MTSIDSPQLCKWTRVICNSFFNNSPMKMSYANDFIDKRVLINRKSSNAFKNKTYFEKQKY